jgi:hypothetical protein
VSAGTFIVCGCPVNPSGHRSGCWYDEVETIAREGRDAAAVYDPPRHPLVNVVIALAEHGHLRDLTSDEQLLGLLDDLYAGDLLGPAEDECDG